MTVIAEVNLDLEFAQRLMDARHRRGLTQAQAAVEVGTSPQTWSRWEAGHKPQMRFRTAVDRFIEHRGALRLIRQANEQPVPHQDLTPLQERAIETYLTRVSTPPVSPEEINGFRSVFLKLGIAWDE